MWRFILVVFGLLGFGFYELSGGADYSPRAGSLQAAQFAVFKTPDVTQTRLAARDSSAATGDETAVVTRAAFDPAELPQLNTSLPQIATSGGVKPMFEPAKIVPAATTPIVEPEPVKDMRTVSATRVNMRMGPGTKYDVVTKLTQGTEVEVIRDTGDGWVKLRVADTGRIGWMADYLLTAAAN